MHQRKSEQLKAEAPRRAFEVEEDQRRNLDYMALVVLGAAAGTAAAGMYLDAKLGLGRDLREISRNNETAKLYAKAVRENRESVYYIFEETAARRGNAEGIWSREGCYTFSQVYDRVNQYARWYLGHGVKPHDIVAFYLHNSPEFMFAWLGLLAIGAAPAMINYNLAGPALIHCLKVPRAKLMLVEDDTQLASRINTVREELIGALGMDIVVMDPSTRAEIYNQPAERVEDVYRAGIKGDKPMCLFYTSGTTGMPKACAFQHQRAFPKSAAHKIGGERITTEQDRWYNCMPLYHGTGGTMSLFHLLNGLTLCIGKRFSTSKFWDDARDSRATWFTYVGETARYLLAAPPSPRDKDHSVRGMLGNGLRPDVWFKFCERFGIAEVVEFFNSTEGVFALENWVKGGYLATAVGHHGAILRHRYRNVFVPALVDQESGSLARNPKTGLVIRQPYEVGGEIIVQVPETSAFSGYFNNEEATAKKFERNVFKKGDLWYRTGDALRRTRDGRWFFLDRLGDTFRWKGENVSTAEVSEAIGKFPGVVEANVYGVEVPHHDGRAGCAAIYIDPSVRSTFDYAGLLRHTRKQLPRYAVPVFLRIVKNMTPIHNNKQNKVPLRQEGIDLDKVNPEDKILWVEKLGKGDTYVEFQTRDWEHLTAGKARL